MASLGLSASLLLVVCGLCVAVSAHNFYSGNRQYLNKRCAELEEVTDNSTCKFGVYEENSCGGKVACSNGIEAKCDKPRSSFRYGQCAKGLLCNNCGQCQGCVQTGAERYCYENLMCIHKTKQHLGIADNYPMYNNFEY